MNLIYYLLWPEKKKSKVIFNDNKFISEYYVFQILLIIFLPVQPNNDLEKKIIEAFEVFDHSGKQVVDVREIGTILRSLGKMLNNYF